MITAQRVMKAAGKYMSRGVIAVRTAMGASADRHCTACGSDVAGFFRYGDCADWGCPVCLSSPRERLVNHLIGKGVLVLPSDGSVLHIAPGEASLVERFRRTVRDYVPADIDPSRYKVTGMHRIDLMDIDEWNRFDLFYASHVMEHVPDDAQVLREIFAALKPGGEAWLIVPLRDGPTEDGTPGMTARERERRFGQWDHVRYYGMDFAERISAAGFAVDVLRAEDCPADEVTRFGLDDIIFRARKPLTDG